LASRINNHISRPPMVAFTLNGRPAEAPEGETLMAALMMEGNRDWATDRDGASRAPFCNMGVCFDCLVMVAPDDAAHPARKVRACLTPVRAGMVVTTPQTSGKGPVA